MSLARYPSFLFEFERYRRSAVGQKVALEDIYPCLHDRTQTTAFDAHYLFQSVWALSRLAAAAPRAHLDVASDFRFATSVSALCDVTFVDIRPLEIELDGFQPLRGSITSLPVESASQASVSCLHVAEHIGLGRYGDDVDPEGTARACDELARVVGPGGRLYFSVPIGRERTCFNAHRVFAPPTPVRLFGDLELVDFSFVDDVGRLHTSVELPRERELEFGCGLYEFRRAIESP